MDEALFFFAKSEFYVELEGKWTGNFYLIIHTKTGTCIHILFRKYMKKYQNSE